jgi:hypothetical protein
MPTLVAWQAEVLSAQLLTQPQVAQLFKDTATVSANTTAFTDAARRFAEASSRFSDTIEAFCTQLPAQQATLVKQLNEVATTQRIAAIEQASNDVTVLCDTSIRQLNAVVAEQRETAVAQTRNLIFTSAGSLLIVLIIYRLSVGTVGTHITRRTSESSASEGGRERPGGDVYSNASVPAGLKEEG